ncbi:LYR motif-containing protein 9-like [Neocloeon triangulifer]|uniref:LYR motif-containing protein 9-like n=1 Tax=Neocloeon triangulifer TaxID=2078957 RepID=UPI00286EF0AB|nr:LYR motif-containing protein 9-like [Neocloeon triangulifer]
MSAQSITCPKVLFRYLMRQCQRLPKGPKEHYQHYIKQSFKQHVHEKDPERIQEIMKRSVEDAEWIMKKYKNYKAPGSTKVPGV